MSAPSPMTYIPDKVIQLLSELDPAIWSVESSSKGCQLRIGGRVCQTFPRRRGTTQGACFERNALAAVRRAVRNLE